MGSRSVKVLKRRLLSLTGVPAVNRLAVRMIRANPRLSKESAEAFTHTLSPYGLIRVSSGNGKSLTFCSHGDDWLVSSLFWQGLDSYEPEALPLFGRLSTGARVILDIGAHVGIYTLVAAQRAPTAKIFAFEPVPLVYERLSCHLSINHAENVTCVHAAVADDRGQSLIFHPADRPDTVGSRDVDHCTTRADGPWRCDIVPTVDVDSFVDSTKIQNVDLVKIDVEGSEAEVLTGMNRVLRRDRPTIMCEVLPGGWATSESGEAIDHLLSSLGYHFYLLTRDGPVERERLIGDDDNWNQLFTTLDGHTLADRLAGADECHRPAGIRRHSHRLRS